MSEKGMLVVTRKIGQAIQVTTDKGEIIEIGLFQIKGTRQARIGIKCDKSFKIDRIDNGVSEREHEHRSN